MAMGIAFRSRLCQAFALAAAAIFFLPTVAAQDRGRPHAWLDESLAEYLAYRYLEEREPAAARQMLERALEESQTAAAQRPLALGARLYEEAGADAARATLRRRGMMVFRTLEAAIGRRRVDAAIKLFYERHRSGSATVEDFRDICEEIAGRDLGWFFRYYLDAAGLPTLELRHLPALSPNEFAGEIVLGDVPQEFTLRVEMTLTTAEGSLEHSLATRGLRTPFTVTTASPVLSFVLDPHIRILRRTSP
jgi:hypothetical protein